MALFYHKLTVGTKPSRNLLNISGYFRLCDFIPADNLFRACVNLKIIYKQGANSSVK